MDKIERVQKIEAAPDGSIFVVRAPNDMFWRIGDSGYTEDIQEARKFTKDEIIERLINNGFMDKTIEIFTSTASV